MHGTLTREELRTVAEVIMLIRDMIAEAGSIPSGVLYAQLMAYMRLDTYQFVISSLKDAGLVSESNHVLTYTGKRPRA